MAIKEFVVRTSTECARRIALHDLSEANREGFEESSEH